MHLPVFAFIFLKKIAHETHLTPVLFTPERDTSFNCKSKILFRKDCAWLRTPTSYATLVLLDSTALPTFLEKISTLHQ